MLFVLLLIAVMTTCTLLPLYASFSTAEIHLIGHYCNRRVSFIVSPSEDSDAAGITEGNAITRAKAGLGGVLSNVGGLEMLRTWI